MSKVVIGIGADHRGDDAAGLEAARRVTGADLVHIAPPLPDLADFWDEDDDVVVVDAMDAGLDPGTVHRIDATDQPLPSGAAFVTTHALGPVAAIELARVLRRMPRRLRVYGIQIAGSRLGAGLSPAVARAVADVAKEIDHA